MQHNPLTHSGGRPQRRGRPPNTNPGTRHGNRRRHRNRLQHNTNGFVAHGSRTRAQNQLRNQKSILSRQQSAFSDLKSLYSKVSDRLDNLNTADSWQRRTATSSDTKVAATVNSDAAIGQFTFTVEQTAAAHAVYTADTVAADDLVSETGTYAGMTATEAVAAINDDDTLDTTAALIQTAPGEYRIQLSAKNTGVDSTVGVDASEFDRLVSGFTTLTTGRDAQISVSGDSPLVITSDTNTFDDVMPGLDITVTEPSTEAVTVTVNEDIDGLADDMAAMFDDLIGAINRVDGLTKTNESTSSLLSSASVLRRSENNLRNAVFNEVSSSTLQQHHSQASTSPVKEQSVSTNRNSSTPTTATRKPSKTCSSLTTPLKKPSSVASTPNLKPRPTSPAVTSQLQRTPSNSEFATLTTKSLPGTSASTNGNLTIGEPSRH